MREGWVSLVFSGILEAGFLVFGEVHVLCSGVWLRMLRTWRLWWRQYGDEKEFWFMYLEELA